MDKILFIIIFANLSLFAVGNDKFSSNLQRTNIGVSRKTMALDKRGLHLNVGIPVPKVPLPDPTYTLSHTLDYFPYKKFYKVNLSTVIGKVHKVFWYLYDLTYLVLRLAFQVFDIFQMKKSFDSLSHGGGGPGGGWSGGGEDDDWRKL